MHDRRKKGSPLHKALVLEVGRAKLGHTPTQARPAKEFRAGLRPDIFLKSQAQAW